MKHGKSNYKTKKCITAKNYKDAKHFFKLENIPHYFTKQL